ncbi:MAG: hypothetical protein EAX81_03710 [Candidatus Thorarchaeota archaeon]|nr:hypothetical protein [Candidatus Thorarchaeota archaeon]
MFEEKDALDLAVSSYETTEFYRWFYDKHKIDPYKTTYDALPILRRNEIFEYQELTGKPYYGMDIPDTDLIRLETSGSTGRPLQVIYTKERWEKAYGILRHGFDQFGIHKKIFTYHSIPLEKMLEPLMSTWGLETKFISSSDMLDVKLVRDAIKAEKPDVIYDATGRWLLHLLEGGLPLGEMGVKAFLIMRADNHDIQTLREKGMNLLFFLPSTDLGCIACSCPHSVSFHLAEEPLFHVSSNDRLDSVGEGELVATFPFSILPLIKYTNNDYVRLVKKDCICGFSGRFLQFIGRSMQVKVPDVEGWYVDVDKVYHEFFDRYKKPILMMFMTARIKGRGKAVDMLATFIESHESKDPILRYDLSNDVVSVGTGKYLPDLVDVLPVIIVPSGSIPIIDKKGTKPRMFLDIRARTPQQEYNALIETLNELASAKIQFEDQSKTSNL